jgi:hypothetical protein
VRQLSRLLEVGDVMLQIEGTYDPEDAGGTILFDTFGNKLPPFIVMEKGESLIDWSKRKTSDVFQAVAVRIYPFKIPL